MKSTLLLSCAHLLLLLTSCAGRTLPIGEAPLKLSNFNFATPITDLYPDKNRSKEYAGYYTIPTKYLSHLVQQDTTFIEGNVDGKKAVGIEYRQESSSTSDTLALFEDVAFTKVNIATTLDGKIKFVCAVADELSAVQSQELIEAVSHKYGKCQKMPGEFAGKPYSIYQWQTKDVVYRYASVPNDGNATLRINASKQPPTISQGSAGLYSTGYLYIIQKLYIKDTQTLHTGDFIYID